MRGVFILLPPPVTMATPPPRVIDSPGWAEVSQSRAWRSLQWEGAVRAPGTLPIPLPGALRTPSFFTGPTEGPSCWALWG